MAAMLQIRLKRAATPTRTEEWIDAGFNRATATPWRSTGWEPTEAAAWRAASPADGPAHLRRLRDEGYRADQLEQVGQRVRGHVAAWTAATMRPADGRTWDGAARAAAAHLVLSQLALDLPGVEGSSPDVVLDLRDRVVTPV